MADATVVPLGGSIGQIRALNDNPLTVVPCNITVGATYATGGNPVPMPDTLDSRKLVAIQLCRYNDGTRYWDWDGSISAPKLKAVDAFQTEEGNGTSTAGVILPAVLYFEN